MKERLLLNRIGIYRGNIAVFQGVKPPANIPAGGAEAQLSLRD